MRPGGAAPQGGDGPRADPPADPPRAGGLTSSQAAAKLAEAGLNVLPRSRGIPLWRHLTHQFFHFFAVMLWIAAGLAVLAGINELALAICLVVLINGVFAFVQEYRAERAADQLRHMLPLRARVRRDGVEIAIPAAEVVPGDLAVLAEGDRITADMECLEADLLQVDTSALTGESVPESPMAGEALLAGTYVVRGKGTGRVTATGTGTRFARIAEMSSGQRRPPTPLELDIRALVRRLAVIAVGVGVSFFLVMVLLGATPSSGFVFAIGVIVALVPEGLLPTVTLSLAVGAQRMARENALVRRLESVETLGSTTVICTDKTGTLTQNRMNIVEVWTPAGRATVTGPGYDPTATIDRASPSADVALRRAAESARRCSEGRIGQTDDGRWVPHGDPMDAAVDALAHRLGLGPAPEPSGYRPFDPQLLMAIARLPDRLVCKGAPEAVFAACAGIPAGAHDQLHALAARGLRVLAVAEGPPTSDPPATRDLVLLGLLAFEDPPRESVADAIADCRRAGIHLVMLTGDHPRTARAIATEIGLALPGSPVVLGSELPEDDDELGGVVDHDGMVLARITPVDKLRIAAALRKRGHVVAMTGDGVNDAPALTEADIGIAMGASGTDVAREAADLVLLDDHFATIVTAVRLGRGTFLNARRFLTYHLTSNVAELVPFLVWAASGGNFPLALGVLQILCVDVGTDTLTAIAMGADRPSRRVLDHPPLGGALLDRTVSTRAFGILGPWEALATMAVFVLAMVVQGWHPGLAYPTGSELAAASGGAFLTVIVIQAFNAFACRSTSHSAWRVGVAGNWLLVGAVAVSLVFAIGLLVVPPAAAALGQSWPPSQVLPVILVAAALLWVIDATWKRVRLRRRAVSPVLRP